MRSPGPSATASPPANFSWKKRAAVFFVHLGILALGAVVFSLAFPSLVSRDGLWPLAYVAIVPAFYVASRASWKTVALCGAFYGFVTYAVFNYWLLTFHPLAIFIVPTIYLSYFFVAFPFLRLAVFLFPRYGYIVQVLMWMSYEFLRTTGFLGYAYGIIGYSQYLFLPLLRIADIAGVWGVSFLVVFPSAYLAAALRETCEGGVGAKLREFTRRHRIEAFAYAAVFVLACGYGFFAPVSLEGAREWRVALVQQNIDRFFPCDGYKIDRNLILALFYAGTQFGHRGAVHLYPALQDYLLAGSARSDASGGKHFLQPFALIRPIGNLLASTPFFAAGRRRGDIFLRCHWLCHGCDCTPLQ